VPVRAVPGHRPAGRALVGEDAVECQLALPRESAVFLPQPPGAIPADPPIRVATLAADPELPLPAHGSAPPSEGLWLPVGPGGDEGAAIGIDLQRSGGLLVVGPAGSGRSAALRAFALHCAHAGTAVAHLGDPLPSAHALATTPARDRLGHPDHLDRADPAGLRAWLTHQDPSRLVVIVVDDLPTLTDAVTDLLAAPVRPAGRTVVLAAGTAADLAGSFRGPAVALRRSRTALLLRPAAGDAELLGLRTPRTPLPARPGAGWLVTPTQATRVQVALRRRPPAPPR
jgi:S-DNA-T family DNA segregation ATPase FtsK/SpoIIIE